MRLDALPLSAATATATTTVAPTTSTATVATAATATATATKTAAATAAAKAATAESATATAESATTAAPRRTLSGLVDAQRTTIQHLSVELLDGRKGILVRRHRDERETSRTSRHPIRDDVHVRGTSADASEQLFQRADGRVERQVPHVQSIAHSRVP